MVRVSLALLLLLGACEGPPGPPGRDAPGALDAAVALDAAGVDAAPPRDAGADAATPPARASLAGHVHEPNGELVRTGRVVLLPRERVAALAERPIDLSLTGSAAAGADNDEPLEDPIAQDPTLAQALVQDDGSYRFETIADGAFFVVYLPAAGDESHLPGGDVARAPLAAETLRGAQLELEVSGSPSPRARYVGSSGCVNCHARQTSFASAHALTLRVPGLSAPLQSEPSVQHLDEALSAFRGGQTLYFYDCDSATCSVDTSAPSAPSQVRLRAQLGLEPSSGPDAPSRYYVELTSTAGPQRYPVVLTLGGVSTLQQYVTRVPLAAGGFTHFVLPFSYQPAGLDGAAVRDRRWVAYRVADWLELASAELHVPPHDSAFERQCAGCHATGFSAQGNQTDGYRGSAVSDPNGNYDLDGDGKKELLAVGCESCHGPGSEHLELSPRGQHIVSPQLLTPERSSLLCGTCHARQVGKHGEQAPLNDALQMPRAGISRSALLTSHVSRLDLGPDLAFASGDPKLGYQQYSDFVRSPKYRNDALLVTCADCHDPHRTAGFALDLRDEGGNGSCAGCHLQSKHLTQHVNDKVGYAHDLGVDAAALTCSRCHMVRTGSSGARVAALRDLSDPARPFTYLGGDRASHRFVYTDRSHAAEQPVAATDACAYCHGELFEKP